MKHFFLPVVFLLSCLTTQAQSSVSGYVTNKNGEYLIGASVFIPNSPYASITDDDGFYILDSIPTGSYDLKCSYLGYKDAYVSITIEEENYHDFKMEGSFYNLEEIEIIANELEPLDPFAFEQINKKDISMKMLGQDLPYLVEHVPSMVVTSDAGAGIGYTGMRIRGSDATRINVTINGVPLNDSESHGVFWVNLPDFSESVEDIQIQRGVGPSTNGAGAFGGTIGLNTNQLYQNGFIKVNASYGSFNSRRIGVSMNTGLINNSIQVEGRYSKIDSDGYVDRASANLQSYAFSIAKVSPRSSLRFNIFSGSEKTYQAWWGVPEAIITGDEEALRTHYFNNVGSIYLTEADSLNLFNSDRRYNYYRYRNQVDDYRQNHYQLFHSYSLSPKFSLTTTLHYTKGKGFFEEYRTGENIEDYGLIGPLEFSDVIRRRWLDNHFYGAIVNAEYELNPSSHIVFGGGINKYDGDHFGQVIAADSSIMQIPTQRYYENNGNKTDLNLYTKLNFGIGLNLDLFGDIQYRKIDYTAAGDDNGGGLVDIDADYSFISPKLGLSYKINDKNNVYLSYARGNREPVRSDFVDAVGTAVPQHESLNDIEFGLHHFADYMNLSANMYFMQYTNQLVVTGAVNDVGTPVRQNVDNSYRAGIELQGRYDFSGNLSWYPNVTFSRNKIEAFDEIIVDYDTGSNIVNNLSDIDIAFSPSVIAGSRLEYEMDNGINITWLSKYVGKQYLDNTSNESRKLDPYWTNDLVVRYNLYSELLEDVEFKLLINNFLNSTYVSNGYTYSYKFVDLITENFYYPQAGINFMLGLSVKF